MSISIVAYYLQVSSRLAAQQEEAIQQLADRFLHSIDRAIESKISTAIAQLPKPESPITKVS